jgi:assimilatory nitrate reductase catalytic subunit
MRPVSSTCCYCGVGCGVVIEAEGNRIVGVRGDPHHPANRGRLCSKGQTLHLTTGSTGRLMYPEMRAARTEPRRRVTWDAALDHAAERFAHTIDAYGPDSVAFYVSGQLLTEDYYAFNKLARALAGTNNIDSNSRLCMSSAVAGYKATLGADGPPGCYDDIEHADCIVIAGSNAAWAHPVLFRRIEDARRARPDLKVIVVDPRRTATAEIADLHLAILPGTDVALFHGMLHVLLWEEMIDAAFIDAHTEGFAALKATLRDYTPKFAAELCGIREDEVIAAARAFGRAKAALSLYCMGLNQSASGTDKNAALINLHLATGQIGRAGAGPFSLTGQPNAMGGRETGSMANLLPAHRDPAVAADRAELALLWGVASLPANPGKTAVEMFEAMRKGEIRAVWIACTNPAQSLPAQAQVRAALERVELVVLQEAFSGTETAPYADVLLPAASWGEKDGTVTNSERRISRVRAAVRAPGEARADWAITVDFARRLEARLRPGSASLFAFESPQDIFDEYRGLTRGRGTDISGLSYALLERAGPQQWPLPEGAETGLARLYADGRFPTASARARFADAVYRPVVEKVDAHYPFRLITGRLRDQWHAMSRTGRSARLFGHTPEPRVALHPSDLARRSLRPGDLVHVESRRGRVTLAAEASDDLRPGQAFLPMHWGSRFLSGEGALGVNAVTLPVFDPVSRQPELKACAVRITRAALPWRLVAFGYPSDGDALALFDALQPMLQRFAFACCVLLGREREGVLLRAAAESPAHPAIIEAIDRCFSLAGADSLRYDDMRRGNGRRVRLDDGRIEAARLSGDTAAEGWLKEMFEQRAGAAELGRRLLSPDALAPSGIAARGRVVCNCWNVGESEIAAFASGRSGPADAVLEALHGALKCGTECGSCLPELRRICTATRAKEAA